jgi:hypothetical protein
VYREAEAGDFSQKRRIRELEHGNRFISFFQVAKKNKKRAPGRVVLLLLLLLLLLLRNAEM